MPSPKSEIDASAVLVADPASDDDDFVKVSRSQRTDTFGSEVTDGFQVHEAGDLLHSGLVQTATADLLNSKTTTHPTFIEALEKADANTVSNWWYHERDNFPLDEGSTVYPSADIANGRFALINLRGILMDDNEERDASVTADNQAKYDSIREELEAGTYKHHSPRRSHPDAKDVCTVSVRRTPADPTFACHSHSVRNKIHQQYSTNLVRHLLSTACLTHRVKAKKSSVSCFPLHCPEKPDGMWTSIEVVDGHSGALGGDKSQQSPSNRYGLRKWRTVPKIYSPGSHPLISPAPTFVSLKNQWNRQSELIRIIDFFSLVRATLVHDQKIKGHHPSLSTSRHTCAMPKPNASDERNSVADSVESIDPAIDYIEPDSRSSTFGSDMNEDGFVNLSANSGQLVTSTAIDFVLKDLFTCDFSQFTATLEGANVDTVDEWWYEAFPLFSEDAKDTSFVGNDQAHGRYIMLSLRSTMTNGAEKKYREAASNKYQSVKDELEKGTYERPATMGYGSVNDSESTAMKTEPRKREQ
ncbi:hypothetical protein BD324DRAFT_655808 [Kockovaella imperatae]|uniref:Uncharacterized protein n=1 Tax=Kockovaella imperatae TaxID=4999 RepID=A0A1Y1UKF4_9TREE|nr:hypothetical protein BD324DRAFT_655808 [Kockovaella imperatae]ORX38528.1 hypothetical protein BD324DRAFT_655808 [Kockovaella imperatae]